MNVAFRKVWRDLWNNKGRTALVVASIAVGVLALGMITASNSLMARQMTISQQASQPSHVSMGLRGLVDDGALKSLARLPEVEDAEGVLEGGIRWKPALDAEWSNAGLVARADYGAQKFDVVELREGAWPDGDSIAVEFNHSAPFNVPPIGGTVYFEVNGRAKPVRIGGSVRDPSRFPPPFAESPTFFISRNLMQELAGFRDFNLINFTIPDYTKAKAEAAAAVVEDRLIKLGLSAGVPQINDPNRHTLQDLMDGVGLILLVMAALSLGMSVFLVVNTLNAILAQQIPQIGIMKTVGGLRGQIAQLYLAGVIVYCALSLLIAVPIGALGGNALAGWMLGLINVPASSFEILQQSLWLQLLTGLLIPLAAALWPIVQGVAISVREALNAYGLGTGRYGNRLIDRLLGRVQGLPRMAALALRNTFRRLGRVALTQVTLVSAGAIFMMVLSTHYSFNETINTIFRSFGYDVIIGFQQFQRVEEVEPLLRARPNVDFAEMWVFRSAALRKEGASGPGSDYIVFLRGIPQNTQLFAPQVVAGRNLTPQDGHALLLNQKLAREMGVNVGDRVVLDLDDRGESTWTVVGLLFDLSANQTTAYVSIDTLGKQIGEVGLAGIAWIRLKDSDRDTQAAMERDLRDYFKAQGMELGFTNSAIKDQEQSNAQFSILTTLLLIMTFLIAVVGSIGLSGTLSINVLERRREIGVMRAVGASSMDVALIFMGEGLLLGLLSWALAAPLSVVAGQAFVEMIGEVIDFPAQYFFSFAGVWIWLGLVTTLSLVASWLPARRATQISVRESLAYE
ncbi:MAG: FtsX-like permease family protein [Anaerolineales bacterium]